MDYEKAYKEALERAREWYNKTEPDSYTCIVESIFPELKESEDEKIRKEMIAFLQETIDTVGESPNIWTLRNAKKWLAWLEKQGEQKQDPCKECKYPKLNCHNFPCIDKKAFEKGKSVLEVINEEKVDNANKIEPKTKQEWSDEDEGFLRAAIKTCLENYGQYSEIANWLKSLKQRYISLKQRYIWKPSDKQIRALRWVLNNIPYNTHKEEISGLLDQIKDL